MELETFHPHVASRSCEACRKFKFNDEIKEGRWVFAKEPTDFRGKPLPRYDGDNPPCEKDRDGCPKGHWSAPVEISLKNQLAWQHYRECKAVCQFPDDPIVRLHAGIIAEIESQKQRVEEIELASMRSSRFS